MHRHWPLLPLACLTLAALPLAGCAPASSSPGELDLIWGRRGISEGRLQKPRALAIDAADRLYVVDMTARIQVFDRDGQYLFGFRTPVHVNGRPSGLAFGNDGNLLVADTHYFRLLVYTPEGQLLENRTIGGQNGPGPGEFGFVTHALQDRENNIYISEYGEFDRVQKFTPDGKFLLQWGSHGSEPGQFIRPQKMVLDESNQIWIVDACNHRVQVFDTAGKLRKIWGTHGTDPGKLSYPYDLVLDGAGHVYLCEYGNHRIQKFDLDGNSLGCWGTHGRGDGQFHNPWGIERDSHGTLHVLDTNNHRVQRVEF